MTLFRQAVEREAKRPKLEELEVPRSCWKLCSPMACKNHLGRCLNCFQSQRRPSQLSWKRSLKLRRRRNCWKGWVSCKLKHVATCLRCCIIVEPGGTGLTCDRFVLLLTIRGFHHEGQYELTPLWMMTHFWLLDAFLRGLTFEISCARVPPKRMKCRPRPFWQLWRGASWSGARWGKRVTDEIGNLHLIDGI